MTTEKSNQGAEALLRPGVMGTNLGFAKEHNLRAVVDAVRRHGALTRADITRVTELSAQTVSNLVGELESQGLLVAGEPQKAKRGQPARPYSLNPGGGFSIGIQVDYQMALATLVNLAGEEFVQVEQAISRPAPEDGVDILADMVDRLLEKAHVSRDQVFGIGVAIPGPFCVSGPTGIGPGWVDFPLEEKLGEKTGLPVIVENDANAAAIAERLHGAGKDLENFVYVFIGMGLGAGLFVNGQIYRGIRGAAGEIGHIIVDPGGRLCECGNHGCLERYVSLRAAYEAIGEQEDCSNGLELLERKLDEKDPDMMAWLKDAADKLRLGVLALESTLDPEAIFVGGILPNKITKALLRELLPLFPSITTHGGLHEPHIQPGVSAPSAPAHGAASVPIFNEFDPEPRMPRRT